MAPGRVPRTRQSPTHQRGRVLAAVSSPTCACVDAQIALFVCCLGLLGIQLWYRPFVDRTDDGVAVVAMVALLLVSGVQLYVACLGACWLFAAVLHGCTAD